MPSPVARRCQRQIGVKLVRNLPCQRYRAMMPADEGNDEAPGLRHGNDRCVGAFVLQMRGHRADQDAGRADADDRTAAAEQIGDMCPRLAEMMWRLRAAHGMAMNIGIKFARQLSGQHKPGLRQAQNDRPRWFRRAQLIHGSSPL